ncbi:NAD(P)/FAD-dependent oxidoreductase [Dongia sedimenti]|uniref:NAD(P)/FAD-dependent oxidoreductase n=1 Tax=Dongia sedimenti TaxID=3064282 RepID=A0ABU0YR42_9PROT|nr:NAD(P)/FAD-dependent oxidoreductase [Rhodospirillaceae bacterium R-7]
MSESVDAVVVGAGVIGLAVARRLALDGREVLVLERNDAIGSETSARNSEVIHAGIYNLPRRLKSSLCVAGRSMLYRYCAQHGVPHARTGKLIVAVEPSEIAALARLKEQGELNGVDDLVWLTGDAAMALEPQLVCVAAVLSPSTGIIDGHQLMLALQGDLEAAGGAVALSAPVEAGEVRNDGILLSVGGEEPTRLHARTVINAAGLGAMDLARALKGLPPQHAAPVWWAKGNYFRLTGKAPFSRLVYPMPVPGGTGTHMTLDLAGHARFGPDVEWIDRLDYAVDPRRGDSFYEDIRRYWPDLPDGALAPDYAGVRPKLGPAGSPNLDFRIEGPAQHGVRGLVNLFGIESPGLTSCLAIADHVAGLLGESDIIERRA